MEILSNLIKNTDILASATDLIKTVSGKYTDTEKTSFANLLDGIKEINKTIDKKVSDINNNSLKEETKVSKKDLNVVKDDLKIKKDLETNAKAEVKSVIKTEAQKVLKTVTDSALKSENTNQLSEDTVSVKNDIVLKETELVDFDDNISNEISAETEEALILQDDIEDVCSTVEQAAFDILENFETNVTIKTQNLAVDVLLNNDKKSSEVPVTEEEQVLGTESSDAVNLEENDIQKSNFKVQVNENVKIDNSQKYDTSKLEKLSQKIEVKVEKSDEVEETEDNQPDVQQNQTLKEDLSETFLKVQIASENTQDTNEILKNTNQFKNTTKKVETFLQDDEIKIDEADITENDNENSADLNFEQNSNTNFQNHENISMNGSLSDGIESVSHAGKGFETIKNVARSELNINTKADVVNQIAEKFSQFKDGTTMKVNIILQPENLGKVGVELVSRPNGISARILADTQQVKELLDKSIDTLKNSLAVQGVNVNNIVVKAVEGMQGSELNFAQNFNFSNDENLQKHSTAQADMNSNSNGDRKNNSEDGEEIGANSYDNEENSVEMKEAQKLYSLHSGQVDLVV